MSQIGTRPSPHRAITAGDICTMAGRLIGLHGPSALSVADHFVEQHRILGDARREDAWRAVRSLVADILAGSQPQDGPTIH